MKLNNFYSSTNVFTIFFYFPSRYVLHPRATGFTFLVEELRKRELDVVGGGGRLISKFRGSFLYLIRNYNFEILFPGAF